MEGKGFSMFQGLDIPEVPTGCTELGIVCEMSGIKNHFNAKFDCVCERQFQMKADGFYHWGWTLKGLNVLGITRLEQGWFSGGKCRNEQ